MFKRFSLVLISFIVFVLVGCGSGSVEEVGSVQSEERTTNPAIETQFDFYDDLGYAMSLDGKTLMLDIVPTEPSNGEFLNVPCDAYATFSYNANEIYSYAVDDEIVKVELYGTDVIQLVNDYVLEAVNKYGLNYSVDRSETSTTDQGTLVDTYKYDNGCEIIIKTNPQTNYSAIEMQ